MPPNAMSAMPPTPDRYPADLGYRMPAEWAPHEATWIAWPHREADWPEKFGPIPWVYAEIVRVLHRAERVRILVTDAAAEEVARAHLGAVPVDLALVDFVRQPTDRVWTRDYGPIFVTGRAGERAVTDWHFNGWAKYPDWHRDDAVTQALGARFGWTCWQPVHQTPGGPRRLVLEGGSIDVDGAGLLLTTEECLLGDTQQRNPGLTRADLEAAFARYLGVAEVVWLGRGIAGDDTHGHIDDLARFVAPGRVVTVVEDDPADENYGPLRENLDRLRGYRTRSGGSLDVATLPMPGPVVFQGLRLPASYANFYVANDQVLVPTFNDPNDRVAMGVLSDLFPGRTVVGVHATDLVWGLGTLHCLTQQEPRPAGSPRPG